MSNNSNSDTRILGQGATVVGGPIPVIVSGANAQPGQVIMASDSSDAYWGSVGNITSPTGVVVVSSSGSQVQFLAGISYNVTIQSGSTYQVLQSDYFVEMTSTSNSSVTLPSAPVRGQKHIICGSGSGTPTITVHSGSAATISGRVVTDGTEDFTASSSVYFMVGGAFGTVPYMSSFIYNGTYWYVAPGM